MRFISLILLSTLFWSCSSLKIQQVSEIDNIKEQVVIYQLPQNKINVAVVLTKTSYIPGPYAPYSKTYLEIEPVFTEASEQWAISKVSINTEAVEDTSQSYLLTGDIDKIPASNLSQLSFSGIGFQENIIENYSTPESVIPYYNELGLKKLIIEDKKTSYKEVVVDDSISKRIPIVNIVVRNKTTEELAKDAAKTLAKIRKRKFRLIAGLNKDIPKNADLSLMLAELDKKEKYYLELFLGRQETESIAWQKSILPDSLGKYFLFYLDNNKGVNTSEGLRYELNIEALNLLVNNDVYSKKDKEHLFPYRNSAVVRLSVESENRIVYKQNISLAQFGTIKYLPINVLLNKQLIIDKESGAVIGVK